MVFSKIKSSKDKKEKCVVKGKKLQMRECCIKFRWRRGGSGKGRERKMDGVYETVIKAERRS